MAAPTYPELRGQVVVVTGAARGIGRAIAMAFAEQGTIVVANDRVTDAAAETVELCTGAGAASAIEFAADVGDAEASRTMIDERRRHVRTDRRPRLQRRDQPGLRPPRAAPRDLGRGAAGQHVGTVPLRPAGRCGDGQERARLDHRDRVAGRP